MQQKAAAARKEAEAKEAANKFAFSSFKQKREIKGVEKIDGVNVERIKTEPIKHVSFHFNLNQTQVRYDCNVLGFKLAAWFNYVLIKKRLAITTKRLFIVFPLD